MLEVFGAMLQAWGGVAGEIPRGKRPWYVGQQPAEHEPAVCQGGQEGQLHPGLYQEPSASLLMTPNWEEWWIHRKAVLPYSVTWTGWKVGQRGT